MLKQNVISLYFAAPFATTSTTRSPDHLHWCGTSFSSSLTQKFGARERPGTHFAFTGILRMFVAGSFCSFFAFRQTLGARLRKKGGGNEKAEGDEVEVEDEEVLHCLISSSVLWATPLMS